MKRNKLGMMAFSLLAVASFATSCGDGGFVMPEATGDWTTVHFEELTEIDIGEKTSPEADKLAKYTEQNPLRIALVTDSGTLDDHSFNESAWNGVNAFATKNGQGKINDQKVVRGGKIWTQYYQPAEDEYNTNGRFAAMKEAATEFGADVIVLPGYLFQGAIKMAIESPDFANVSILALDCVKEDDAYQKYEYTDKVTSVIYREEQGGFFAGYGAVMDGFRRLGFVGGMAVPAVVRYGSGYVQGAAYAAEKLGLEEPVAIQYYYAGEFAATTAATTYAKNWYANGSAEVIFASGGAVYQSVLEASKSNNNAPWIGVDVNQHADTTIATRDSIITSAMKNLSEATQVLLSNWVDNDGNWGEQLASNVVTVGAKSGMCKLPTPEADNDPGCWGFKNFTVEQYNEIYDKVVSGEVKVNSFSNDEVLKKNNFGVNPDYCRINYIG